MHVVHLPLVNGRAQNAAMNLTRIREAKGLSQRALGEMVGVDASTINRAEKMHSSAKLHTYIMCAEALGVSLADLFADDRSALEAELIGAFRKIPASRHAELLAMLRLARGEA